MKYAFPLGVAVMTVCGCIALESPADSLALNIPDAHPRLFWTPERLSQARAWHRTNSFTPTTNPSSLNYIYDQLLKYVLTGDAAQCTTAINWALSHTITDQRLQSSVSFDEARWYGEQIILAYDWCYDQWTPAQRSTLIDRWNRYFSLISAKPWGGPTMPTSNYFWGYLRNEFEWGVATKGDNPDWQKHVDFALNSRWTGSFVPYTAESGRGGVPAEGTQYGPYMTGYMAIPLDSLIHFGRNVLAETNWYREFVYAMIYLTTPAPTGRPHDGQRYYQIVPWADCCDRDSDRYYPAAAIHMWDASMRTMAGQFGGSTVGRHARQWVNTVDNNAQFYRHLRAIDGGGRSESFASLPPDYFAPGPGFFSTRSSWDGTGAWVVTQLGDAAVSGHGHHDAGSFQIWHEGQWLSKETTGYSNKIRSPAGGVTSERFGEAHNSILFNGVGPANAYQDGAARTLRVQSAKDYSYVVGDFSGLYRAHASSYPGRDDNPYAKTVIREFLFVRPLNTLVVFDRLESANEILARDTTHLPAPSAAAVTKSFVLHSEHNPTVSGSTVTASSGNSVLKATTLVPNDPAIRVVYEGDIPSPDRNFRYQYRTEINGVGAAQSHFLTVLQARSARGSDLTAEAVDEGASYLVTLTLEGVGKALIRFNKGMTSSAGAFGFAEAGAPSLAPFAIGIQELRVTDDGPAWGRPTPAILRQPTKGK